MNKKTFLFLGRMHPIKGVDILIESFINLHEINRDWQLVLVGPQNDYRILLENQETKLICLEFHARILKITNISLFHARIAKIMKFFEFLNRITQIMKIY